MLRRDHINHIDQRFGALLVLEQPLPVSGDNWQVRCDCGATLTVSGYKLRTGLAKRCKSGCPAQRVVVTYEPVTNRAEVQPKEPRQRDLTRYHLDGTVRSEYRCWMSARRRCSNRTDKDFPRYGGRGIRVCDRWVNDYAAFFADMGPKPSPLHTLDRIDNNRGYEPGNCRWATWDVQQANKRPKCEWRTPDGSLRYPNAPRRATQSGAVLS